MAAKPGGKSSQVLSSIPFDRTFTGERAAEDLACVPADTQFLVGAKTRDPDRYQIIGEHARGGLGCVSRAHDRELGRDVAIKELISRGNLSEVRFMREALITARLEHPGIVPVHEAGRWPDGTPFYAMKLVAGRPLRDLIAERPVEQRIGLLHHVIAVADAIAYAHGRNIIHRDLKPANVIVGDFGETVVIDWGLAKDLSAPDDAAGGPAQVTPGHDSGLTSTGNVMGTPAYMAPEQERGERVDQRADVFAIGAMLWELCAHDKVPPIDRVLRRRTLRRAGVDRDLIAIIEKSLEREPMLRYPHAGALAADLKAFKAGARISARGYSLPAMLVHWARRHRGTALSIAAALSVALAGGGLYVRTIAAERDRAEASNNRLLLEQADRLLMSDPTAAADLLQAYRGRDAQKLAMLRAKALGLGLARMRAQPHTQTIYLAQPLADGTLLTLGDDGTVAKTTPDGKSRVIARGVAPQYTFNYNEKLHLLAYACNATGLCLLDVDSETLRPPPPDRSALAPTCLGSSPDHHLLTALSPSGELVVWSMSERGAAETYYRTSFEDGEQLRFIDDETIAVESTKHIYIVHLPHAGQRVPDREPFGVAGVAHSTTDEKLRLAAGTSADGTVAVIDSQTHQTTRSRPLCRSLVNRIILMSDPPSVAYGCQEGEAGILDLARDKASVLSFLEGGVARVAASTDGRYVMFGGTSGKVVLYDVQTRILRTLLGHTTRITVITPATAAYPYLITGDASGEMRVWPMPVSPLRIAAVTTSRLLEAAPLPGGPVIAVSYDTTIPWATRDGRAGLLTGHGTLHDQLARSAGRPRFALYGTDDAIELWSFEPEPVLHTVRSGHDAVSAMAYAADGERFFVGTRDGSVALWSGAGDASRPLGTIHDSVALVRVVPQSGLAVIAGAKGALWLASETALQPLGSETDSITSLACSPDARWLIVGTAVGRVSLYDLASGARHRVFNGDTWIEFAGFSSDSRQILFSTNGRMRIAGIEREPDGEPRLVRGPGSLELSAHFAAFSPDNAWLAATGDQGDLWFHRASDDRWVYV
ncbi:MAG TPA: WD40 repeat domain-containing serine/threonine-protein kinase, partial [Kofleriaceae bacterium]|nr:WD40 repeat domain-containing serine/threonine-protein kinase [Kofleriaceae bacterium]